ncbi:MAG: hypothetical protein GXP59_05780 [Deltaproteobacteria bacterium]|nr:hypothetical protein [Deltaproteobacteria bacterium]
MGENQNIKEICFGWDRPTDEHSLQAFLKKFSHSELLVALIPRLSDKELTAIVNLLTETMKAHLSEREYHQLFLNCP